MVNLYGKQKHGDKMKKIQEAFDNTDKNYMESSLKQRNPGPAAAGSTFEEQTTFDDLKYAAWLPANDPAIETPAEGYVTKLFGGLLGITKLETLPQNMTVVLQPAHAGKAKIRDGEFISARYIGNLVLTSIFVKNSISLRIFNIKIKLNKTKLI